MSTPASTILAVAAAARQAYAAGLCILPPMEDGSKRPQAVEGTWQQFRTERPASALLKAWWPGRSGLGVIAGAVSGDLEALDFDDRDCYKQFVEDAEACGLLRLVEHIENGYCDDTAGGGVRWLWRCPGATREANAKLARRPKRPDEQRDAHDRVKTLIELPDYAIVAPTNGKVHPTGRAYVRRSGDFSSIRTITLEEREALLALCRTFDAMPVSEAEYPKAATTPGGGRPGDDFNARATWADVLKGWTLLFSRNGIGYWRRPGKPDAGWSATTNFAGLDLFCPFSTATEFEAQKMYSKFAVFTVLAHHGDFKAAAKALAAQGYGEPATRRRTSTSTAPPEASEDGALILDPGAPLPSARTFVERTAQIDGRLGLRHQAGVFYRHDPAVGTYVEHDEAAVRAGLYQFLDTAQAWSKPRGNTEPTLGPFKPTKTKVENVLDALRAVCNLPTAQRAPCWLDEAPTFDPFDILPCRNGLLHIPTRTLLPTTPAFFALNGVEFRYQPEAPAPTAWLAFLDSLWPDDAESRETLQEFIGYVLTPRTHFQKIGMIVGPKRSGKGTIARVLRCLLGERNVCGPTLASLGEQFGLSTLIHKSVAVIADARISGRTETATLTERLLSVSGEDTLSIPRKYLPDWTGKLSTRFLLLTNELPRIEDASGALASRFVLLTLQESFYGREDHALLEKLLPELPSILNWALSGYDRLYARGRFVQPAAASELIQQFEDLASPIGAFVRERCEVGPGFEVLQDRVFDAWKAWCQENGRERAGTTQTLGRNLRAALPWLRTTQPRVDGERPRCWLGLRLRGGL